MKRLILFLCLFISASVQVFGEDLPLDDYLQQVQAGPDYLRAVTNRKQTDLYRLSLGRHWNAGFYLNADRNSYGNYVWNYSTNKYDPYSSENLDIYGTFYANNTWDFGLSTGLNYNVNHNEYWYVNYPYSTTTNHYTYDNFSLNATLPLWQNFLGESTRAQDKRARLYSDASIDYNEFQIQNTLLNAKQAYYTLSGLRMEIAFRRETLEQYRKLWDAAKARKSPQDILQAQTAFESLELALERLDDNERAWRNVLNRYRGKTGSQVEETLLPLDKISAALPADWPSSEPERLDLQAARLNLEGQKLSDQLAREALKLPINLNGSVGGNLFHDNNPVGYPPYPQSLFSNYGVGLNINFPFDIFTNLWDVNARSSKLQLDQSILDEKETENLDSQVWEDMTIRYEKSSDRIKKAEELEAHQREKAEKALALLKAGRLGMFETLAFQDHYLSARLSRLSWISERLNLLAQSQLYQTTLPKKDQ